MIDILKKIFEDNPEKSTAVLKVKCIDCGCEAIIEITRTSGGFGLQGGTLFKCPSGGYSAKCLGCNQGRSKIDDNQKINKKY